jgi:hypothetical protein
LTEIGILINFFIDEVDIKNEISENRKLLNFDPVKYTTAKDYIFAIINLYYQQKIFGLHDYSNSKTSIIKNQLKNLQIQNWKRNRALYIDRIIDTVLEIYEIEII